MRHFFTTLLSFTGLLAAQTSPAQTYPHTSLWLRLAANYTLSLHWQLQGDVLYRRQSHPEHGLTNPLDSPLLMAVRAGISYRTEHWAYILFPLVYFHNYPALGNAADLRRAPVPEWRSTALIEWTTPVSAKTALRLRGGYEYRMFVPGNVPNVGRGRVRVLLRHELARRTYAQFWNETLLSAPPRLPESGTIFEINRTNLAVGRALTNTTTLELGYQFTHRQRRSLVEFDAEHALTVTVFWAVK